MVRLTVQYDGKVLIPDRQIELPRGVPLDVTIDAEESNNGHDTIQELSGLGAEVWEGVDGVEYQRREREGWT